MPKNDEVQNWCQVHWQEGSSVLSGLKVLTVLTHFTSRFSSNGFEFDPKHLQKLFEFQTPKTIPPHHIGEQQEEDIFVTTPQKRLE